MSPENSFNSSIPKDPSQLSTRERLRPRPSLSAIDREQKERHKVHALAAADALWRERRYEECAAKALEAVMPPEPSQAIEARAHMYLASLECDEDDGRVPGSAASL